MRAYAGPAASLGLAISGKAEAVSMESFSRESLLSLLESVESAISELQSRREPRLEGVISRLERRRAEIVAALAAKGRPVSSAEAGSHLYREWVEPAVGKRQGEVTKTLFVRLLRYREGSALWNARRARWASDRMLQPRRRSGGRPSREGDAGNCGDASALRRGPTPAWEVRAGGC